MEVEAKLSALDVDAWREGTKKVRLNEQRTGAEKLALVTDADITMLQAENVHYQHQLGLMYADDWSVWQHNLKWVLATPCYRQFFKSNRNAFRKIFATEIDNMYSNLPEVECPPTSD